MMGLINQSKSVRLTLLASAFNFTFMCDFGLAGSVDHQELLKSRPVRETIWSFDASTIENQFIAPDGSEFAG